MSQRFLLCVLLVSLVFCLVGVSAAQELVTGVSVTVTPSHYNGGCPTTLHFRAVVRLSGVPGVFNYTWERSDNAQSGMKMYTVSSGQHQAVLDETWQLGGAGQSYDVFEYIKVNSGNTHLTSNRAEVHIHCSGGGAPEPLTGVHVTVTPSHYSGTCPVTLHFRATVDVNAYPMVFNYTWERSDNAQSGMKIYTVSSGQHQAVLDETWQLGGAGQSYNVFEYIKVNSGNTHLTSNHAVAHIQCH